MGQVQPDHDCHVGLGGEQPVLGESEDKALEDLVGHRNAGLPQDEPEVEARGLGAVAAAEVLQEGVL